MNYRIIYRRIPNTYLALEKPLKFTTPPTDVIKIADRTFIQMSDGLLGMACEQMMSMILFKAHLVKIDKIKSELDYENRNEGIGIERLVGWAYKNVKSVTHFLSIKTLSKYGDKIFPEGKYWQGGVVDIAERNRVQRAISEGTGSTQLCALNSLEYVEIDSGLVKSLEASCRSYRDEMEPMSHDEFTEYMTIVYTIPRGKLKDDCPNLKTIRLNKAFDDSQHSLKDYFNPEFRIALHEQFLTIWISLLLSLSVLSYANHRSIPFLSNHFNRARVAYRSALGPERVSYQNIPPNAPLGLLKDEMDSFLSTLDPITKQAAQLYLNGDEEFSLYFGDIRIWEDIAELKGLGIKDPNILLEKVTRRISSRYEDLYRKKGIITHRLTFPIEEGQLRAEFKLVPSAFNDKESYEIFKGLQPALSLTIARMLATIPGLLPPNQNGYFSYHIVEEESSKAIRTIASTDSHK